METRRCPVEHGWMRGTVNTILTPVMFPTSVPPAADNIILRMIKRLCDKMWICPMIMLIVMLLCKCQIQMTKRKVTNTGFTMLCQHMYTYCTIAVSANQKGWYVDLLHELIVCMKTLIDQMGIICAIFRIFLSVIKSKIIASFVMTTISSLNRLHTLSKYLFEHYGLYLNYVYV